MSILITGAAGFIGYHLSKKILNKNTEVIGIDNINNYYDINLKKNRLKVLNNFKNFSFIKKDLNEKKLLDKIYSKKKFNIILHLAAQAGVRYSLINPKNYLQNNIDVFLNILEFTKKKEDRKLNICQ